MFCVKCGVSLPDDANFCFKCGCDLRNLNQSAGTELSAVKVGDYVKFGSYPQKNPRGEDPTRGTEPIEWIVLDVNGSEALIISRYTLDCRLYHHELKKITWENCDLRKWLNDGFLNAAFSKEEQQQIKLSEVVNSDNRQFSIYGGKNTKDRVFLLSLAEAERYFKNNAERKCRATTFAKLQGSGCYADGSTWWHLRSPGCDEYTASGVMRDGSLSLQGCVGGVDSHAEVRPALWVNGYSSAKVGDYIKFGTYPQNDDKYIREPIEWLTLDVNGNDYLLISRYGLDCKQYHYRMGAISWEDCTLRRWLNSEFLMEAFSEEEQRRIKLSYVVNDDHPIFGYAEHNTEDRVFLLSIAEAERYFKNNAERMCRFTALAEAHDAGFYFKGLSSWWLRSPGDGLTWASKVNPGGVLNSFGNSVESSDVIRPALWVSL